MTPFYVLGPIFCERPGKSPLIDFQTTAISGGRNVRKGFFPDGTPGHLLGPDCQSEAGRSFLILVIFEKFIRSVPNKN
jgi:hypothetical protein